MLHLFTDAWFLKNQHFVLITAATKHNKSEGYIKCLNLQGISHLPNDTLQNLIILTVMNIKMVSMSSHRVVFVLRGAKYYNLFIVCIH
jgi:hypothetical protein